MLAAPGVRGGATRNQYLMYLAGLLGVGLAIGLTYFLPPLHATPTVLFFAAIVASAWWGGRGPAILAILISTLAVDFLLVTPAFSVLASVADLLRFVVFALVASLCFIFKITTSGSRVSCGKRMKALRRAFRNARPTWQSPMSCCNARFGNASRPRRHSSNPRSTCDKPWRTPPHRFRRRNFCFESCTIESRTICRSSRAFLACKRPELATRPVKSSSGNANNAFAQSRCFINDYVMRRAWRTSTSPITSINWFKSCTAPTMRLAAT